MSIRLIEFDSQTLGTVFVNPDKVRNIFAAPEDQTAIVFDDQYEMWVSQPVAEVRRRLTERE